MVHLVDFDTAVSLDEPDTSDLSQRPVIVYTAPEVTDGGRADERADLYSLGATMYEMAAGHPPFAGTREQILAARRAGPPPAFERDDLPEALRDLIFSLLAPDPEQRPASAAEVIERLDGCGPCAAKSSASWRVTRQRRSSSSHSPYPTGRARKKRAIRTAPTRSLSTRSSKPSLLFSTSTAGRS